MSETQPVADTPTHLPAEIQNYVFAQFMDVFLRIAPRCADAFGGDLTRMMIFYAAARASVAHLNHQNVIRREAESGTFPDDMRRPISILSLSEHLGLPYETVRRHMHALVKDGWCERVGPRGFFVSKTTMQSAPIRQCAEHASGSIFAMYQRFRSQGVFSAKG